jgi:hypothetical protein
MAPLGRCSWRLAGTTAVLLAVAVLWPASSPDPYRHSIPSFGVRLAAGQGLAVSSELLGAGEAATATQLELFEDSLNIATTGGRGRGVWGGSGGLAASAFTDADRLQQLQRGIYYIAAAPKNFTSCQFKYKWRKRRAGDTALRSDCNNFVPSQPRDQVRCDACCVAGLKSSAGVAHRSRGHKPTACVTMQLHCTTAEGSTATSAADMSGTVCEATRSSAVC